MLPWGETDSLKSLRVVLGVGSEGILTDSERRAIVRVVKALKEENTSLKAGNA
jgi:hypothetical protein